ncbi:MAG: hypothetical protein ACOYNP_05635, partial [Gemmataceae bacterium]
DGADCRVIPNFERFEPEDSASRWFSGLHGITTPIKEQCHELWILTSSLCGMGLGMSSWLIRPTRWFYRAIKSEQLINWLTMG